MSSSEQQVGLLCRHEISNGDHPLNRGKTSIWCRYFKVSQSSSFIIQHAVHIPSDLGHAYLA